MPSLQSLHRCNRMTSYLAAPLKLAGLLCLVGIALAPDSGHGQEVSVTDSQVGNVESVMVEPVEGSANDIRFTLDESTYCDSCEDPYSAWSGIPWPRFGMYLKAGPSFQMSKGLFEDGTKVGYEIAFGGRELWVPYNRKVFMDLGFSYLSAFGRGRPKTISGVIERSTLGPQRLDDFQDMTLTEVSRASIHTGLGWFHDFSEVPEVSRLLTCRFGSRLSHIHGHFRETPTEDLEAAIEVAELLGEAFTLANDQEFSKTDTAWGIYTGIELSHTYYTSSGATLAFLVDGEFAADWIDFKNYADDRLVTATVLFGLSVNR